MRTPSLSWLQNLNSKLGALKREKRRAWPFIPEPRVFCTKIINDVNLISQYHPFEFLENEFKKLDKY